MDGLYRLEHSVDTIFHMKEFRLLQQMDMNRIQRKLKQKWRLARYWFIYYIKRCESDNLTMTAGYLSYITLLSIVPLILVMFSIFSAFPAFRSKKAEIENYIYNNFLPASGDVVQTHISEFVENATKMTSVGIVFLMLFALLLIYNIDKTLNRIWRTQAKRRVVISFSVYWMALTLGPVLIGASLAMTSYLVSATAFADAYISGLKATILNVLPYIVSVLAFWMVFMIVPNQPIRGRHAFWGAVLSAFLFELAKQGFAFYIKHFPSYEAIYGALATIPILFVWVYLSWLVVLLGAELTAMLQESSKHHKKRG